MTLFRRIFLAAVCCVTAIFAKGQTEILCQTEPIDSATFFNWPYFGNNQYLLNLVDSLEGINN